MIKYSLITLLVLVAFVGLSHFIPVSANESLLYKMQQYLTYSKEDWENYEHNKSLLAQTDLSENQLADTTEVASPVDLHPVDTNRVAPEIRERELALIQSAHFENLVLAAIRPDHEDAQIALIRFTDRRLTDVIIQQKISIKVGECYDNPNREGNYNCVSCMILLYNRERQDWQEAPDGENFLQNAYDFYQPSEGEDWEAKPLSMRIPFDYKLQKEFEAREG